MIPFSSEEVLCASTSRHTDLHESVTLCIRALCAVLTTCQLALTRQTDQGTGSKPEPRFSRHDFKKMCLLAALLTVLLFTEKRKRVSWVHLCLRGEWIDHLSLLEINGGEISLKAPSTIGHHPRWVYTHRATPNTITICNHSYGQLTKPEIFSLSLHVSS